eukprot:m.179769 g.179769  ORF g.179769 m.179769 type:complete len:81 (-) comp31989_c0_seq1:264-506(-)
MENHVTMFEKWLRMLLLADGGGGDDDDDGVDDDDDDVDADDDDGVDADDGVDVVDIAVTLLSLFLFLLCYYSSPEYVIVV